MIAAADEPQQVVQITAIDDGGRTAAQTDGLHLAVGQVGGITFTVGGAAVTLSGLAIAARCGVILNAILPGNDYEFGVSVTGDKSADLGSY